MLNFNFLYSNKDRIYSLLQENDHMCVITQDAARPFLKAVNLKLIRDCILVKSLLSALDQGMHFFVCQ